MSIHLSLICDNCKTYIEEIDFEQGVKKLRQQAKALALAKTYKGFDVCNGCFQRQDFSEIELILKDKERKF